VGEPVAPLPGGLGGRPPGSGAAEVYSCKFPNRKYIFIKNENKKYKNKKGFFGFLPLQFSDFGRMPLLFTLFETCH